MPAVQFQVNGKLSDGRWSHSALAFPITDLTGDFKLTHGHQILENVTGATATRPFGFPVNGTVRRRKALFKFTAK